MTRRVVETAPAGRAAFRFSSYGDLSTPSWDLNASGNIWHESCDNAYYAVSAIESPGDGGGAPLFHLLNGDRCYANLDILNAPRVWRDFGVNIARSAANRPWMPGPRQPRNRVRRVRPRRAPGERAGRDRGPGSGGELLERPLRLRPGAAIPNGTVTYNHGYTGDLKIVPASNSAVPDPSNGTPHLQTLWLERTLAQARRDRSTTTSAAILSAATIAVRTAPWSRPIRTRPPARRSTPGDPR